MSDTETTSLEEMKFDAENLFREEKITDMKMGAIRVLVPVKVEAATTLRGLQSILVKLRL